MSVVRLNRLEVRIALDIGTYRQLVATENDQRDYYGFNGDGWGVHIEGAAGEVAVARLMNWWLHTELTPSKTRRDVGNVEVRTTTHPDGSLIHYERDDPTAAYILVTGSLPCYDVRGWTWGADARQAQWWREPPAARHESWWVPADQLRPMHELTRVVDAGSSSGT